MRSFETVEQALEFAVAEEERAAAFYSALAQRARSPKLRQLLESFAREERGHKARLQNIQVQADPGFSTAGADRLPPAPQQDEDGPGAFEDPVAALRLAMRKERDAFVLYTSLASIARGPEVKALLEGLAQEEARHKLAFELELDELTRGG